MTKVNPNRPYSYYLTMTVGALIEALGTYDPGLPVIVTWEGVGAGIRLENFRVIEREGRKELEIDVENYG